jgi:hypothetical protein
MKNHFRRLAVFFIFLMMLLSCRKNDETDILSYQLAGQQSDIEIDGVKREITVTFPESTTAANQIAATYTLSEGAIAYVSNLMQVSGQSRNNFELPFSYLVKAEDGKSSAEWDIVASNNSVTLPWGLGGFQTQSKFNNKTYSWYIDQKNTGIYANVNCGPTATTIAAKWSDPAFSKTPEDARAAYRPTGGWWYTSDIHNWLLNNNIPHRYINLSVNASSTESILKEKLDSGKIIILCVDMDKVRSGPTDDRRIDKFYNTTPGWGHFILVKGYRKVSGEFFYEIYDPNSWGSKYTTGELKGIDRYYRTQDIYYASSTWWNYGIVIYEKGTKSVSTTIDISAIPDMWGR